jgi:hypothetical protein
VRTDGLTDARGFLSCSMSPVVTFCSNRRPHLAKRLREAASHEIGGVLHHLPYSLKRYSKMFDGSRTPDECRNSSKRTFETPEHPPYEAPYQNFQLKIGHSAAPGLPEGFYIRVGRRHCADVHEHVFAGHRPRHRVRGSVHTEPCAGPGAGRVHTAP